MTRFGANPGSVVVALLVVLILAGTCWYVFIPANIIGAPTLVSYDPSGESMNRQGDYLQILGKYWSFSYTVDYDQAFTGYLTPTDTASSNQFVTDDQGKAAKVETRKTITIKIEPGVPYVTLQMQKKPIAVVPSATGVKVNAQRWWGLEKEDVTTQPLVVNVFVPMEPLSYVLHLPFKVTILQGATIIGTLDTEKTGSLSEEFNWKIPTSYGDVLISDLGSFVRGKTLPDLKGFMFFQSSSVDPTRLPTLDKNGKAWTIFSSGFDLLSSDNPGSYAAYWFAGTSTLYPEDQFIYSPNESPTWYGKGWVKSVMTVPLQLFKLVAYYPLQPKVALSESADTRSGVADYGYSLTIYYQDRKGLLEWLPSYVNGLSGFSSWEIINPTSDSPTFVGYIQANQYLTRAVNNMVPSGAADTWAYSKIVSKFSIADVKLKDSNGTNIPAGSKLVAGRDYLLTVAVKNLGTLAASCDITVTSPIISSSRFTITSVPAGGTKSETVSVRVGTIVSTGTTDDILVTAYNTEGDIVDQYKFRVIWTPALDNIVITKLALQPDPLPSSGESNILLWISNAGGGLGDTSMRVALSVTGPLQLSQSEILGTIKAGETKKYESIKLTATAATGTGSLSVVVYDRTSGQVLAQASKAIKIAEKDSGTSSNLAIKSYWLEPASFGYGDLFSLVVKVTSSSLLPVEATVAVTGPVTWGAGSMSAIIFPGVAYEARLSMIAPLWGSGTLTIQLFDRTQGVLADTKQQDLSPLGIGLLPIVAVLLLIAGGAYFMASYSSKVPGRGIGKSGRK
jgi:hypothetical protein